MCIQTKTHTKIKIQLFFNIYTSIYIFFFFVCVFVARLEIPHDACEFGNISRLSCRIIYKNTFIYIIYINDILFEPTLVIKFVRLYTLVMSKSKIICCMFI